MALGLLPYAVKHVPRHSNATRPSAGHSRFGEVLGVNPDVTTARETLYHVPLAIPAVIQATALAKFSLCSGLEPSDVRGSAGLVVFARVDRLARHKACACRVWAKHRDVRSAFLWGKAIRYVARGHRFVAGLNGDAFGLEPRDRSFDGGWGAQGEQGKIGNIICIGERKSCINLGIVSHVNAYMYCSEWWDHGVGAKVPP